LIEKTESPEEQLEREIHRNLLGEIACHIIWLNAIALQGVIWGWIRFPKISDNCSSSLAENFRVEEAEFSDQTEDLFETRMEKIILDYVKTLSLDYIITYISDQKPNRYYSEALRVFHVRYRTAKQILSASQSIPDLPMPDYYSTWCKCQVEYLAQLESEYEENTNNLAIFIEVLRKLRNSIHTATAAGCLTTEQLDSLKVKMQTFESRYRAACSEVMPTALHEEHLIITESEQWW
jgi:hypothetical protein